MTRTVTLKEITSVLETLEYPTTPDRVATECRDIVVELADGEVTMSEVIGESQTDSFSSAEDLELSFRMLLPRNAVGEPYQSEGDA